MDETERPTMARSRALLTPTEREHIEAENGSAGEYEAVSRARRRINDELTTDVRLLKEHRPDLLSELREVVCENE